LRLPLACAIVRRMETLAQINPRPSYTIQGVARVVERVTRAHDAVRLGDRADGAVADRLTLDTYQHVLPGMQERAAAKLDAIFNAPRDKKAADAS
jgi:hypothetical protein